LSSIKEYFGFIVNAANSMHQLIEDVLSYAKLESKDNSEFTELDVNLIIDEIISNYQYEIIKKEIIFNISKLPISQFNFKWYKISTQKRTRPYSGNVHPLNG